MHSTPLPCWCTLTPATASLSPVLRVDRCPLPSPWHAHSHSSLEAQGAAQTANQSFKGKTLPCLRKWLWSDTFKQRDGRMDGSHGLLMVTLHYWGSQVKQWAIKNGRSHRRTLGCHLIQTSNFIFETTKVHKRKKKASPRPLSYLTI